MIFVTGRSKRAIEDHFDTAYELETELESAHKEELLKLEKVVERAADAVETIFSVGTERAMNEFNRLQIG